MKVVAVLPAYNEEGHVGEVVGAVLSFVHEAIVVDDGSCDDTAGDARAAGAIVYRHVVNRGLGGAIATGLRAALLHEAGIIVTLDADGQHLPEEIPSVVLPIRSGVADFVVGSRLLDPRGMPFVRRVANRAADLCTLALFGVRVRDSQSGFRAMSRQVAESIDIRTSRMEVSSEIVVEVVRRGFRIVEAPISVIYTEYSLSKGQSVGVGLKTLARLALRRAA